MTISELILTAIEKSFKELTIDGRIIYEKSKKESDDELYDVIAERPSMEGMLQALQKGK